MLNEIVNDKRKFVRCFYGVCPKCGKRIFSIDDNSVENKIVAKFICDCGKKWKETVYSSKKKEYKYPQMLVEEYKDKKRGRIRVLKRLNEVWLVTPDKILHKEVKS